MTTTDDDSGFTIEAPASSLTADRDLTVLALRLSLAVNSLRASHRHFLAVKDAPGPGGERDRLWAFLSATAYVKEAMNILSGTKKAPPQKALVESLARASGASDDLVNTIDRLLAGTHSMSAIVTRVRNKLTFHWDPEVIGLWVDRYDKPNVIYFDASGGTSNGDTLYRAAADAVVYSVLPPTADELALPTQERDKAILERFKQALKDLTGVMAALTDYFERAIATVLRRAGAKPTPAELPGEPPSTEPSTDRMTMPRPPSLKYLAKDESPMSSPNYTQEKLWQAVHLLATGAGPIRERLNYATQYLIRLHHVRPEERAFVEHPELQARFDRVMEMLTSTPATGSEGTIAASTSGLSDEDAKKAAEEIFDLFQAATDLADVPVGFEPRRKP
jgi:hypothetical protein